MVDFKTIATGDGFKYSSAPQGSPEWVALRVGKVTASRLKDWLAVGVKGNALKARADYERELAYEIQFKVPFTHFVTPAMEAGVLNEAYVAQQYSSAMGVAVEPCGAFYNNRFVASPDGLVGDDGLVEIKWLFDNSFSDVLANGVPADHYLQIQGQLWATGRKWCDYVAGNGNTGMFKVIRVEADKDTHSRIKESLVGVEAKAYDDTGLFKFHTEITEDNFDYKGVAL